MINKGLLRARIEYDIEDDIETFNVMNLNCDGLRHKLNDKYFKDFIQSYEIICLTETHMTARELEHYDLTGFKSYVCDAIKLGKSFGRLSGGVVVLIKNCLQHHFTRLSCDVENIITLRISREFFERQNNMIFLACYIPPQDSKFWNYSNCGYGHELLERCFNDLYSQVGHFEYILTGDFNSRTKNFNMINIDIMLDSDDMYKGDENDTIFPRQSKDDILNTFGEQLLEFCSIYDGVIVNGLTEHNYDGGFTCIKSNGSSVVDYFIISSYLMETLFIENFGIVDKIFSDHLPIVLEIKKKANKRRTIKNDSYRNSSNGKIMWTQEKVGVYIDNLKSYKTNQEINYAESLLPGSVDESVDVFTRCLLNAASCMKRQKKNGKCNDQERNKSIAIIKRKQEVLDRDEDYVNLEHECHSKLYMYRTTGSKDDRLNYIASKRDVKIYKRNARNRIEKEEADQMVKDLCNSKHFWMDVKKLVGSGMKHTESEIVSLDDWKLHFENVFANDCDKERLRNPVTSLQSNLKHDLNLEITEKEVKDALARLNNGKASGTDVMTPEMIKTAEQYVAQYLTTLYNTIFCTGVFPKEWSKSIIVPIHKKGRTDMLDNYRGISLINIMCKCYTNILNNRLYSWLEKNNLMHEEQAGFRKNYSTIDHVFTLHAIIQKSLSKPGHKLYVAFVDMRKAFDSVRHDLLFMKMNELGIDGRFLLAIMNMYNSLKACVRDFRGNLTDFFPCPVGVRQGCVLSPTLFSIFVNSIAEKIKNEGKHGIQLLPGMLEILILLFADDIALISQSQIGLQNQLNVLKSICDMLDLSVNEGKTKVMVFRRGGILSRHERWTYGDKPLEVVNNYCYLGYVFTTRLSVVKGIQHMTLKAKKAYGCLIKLLLKSKYITKECYFKVFDLKIAPILMYASEVWGIQNIESIEKVHLMACKHFLGVPISTPNKIVYGELGRYPLFITTYIRSIKFWLRLLKLGHRRITKHAYQSLYQMDLNGKKCWASDVKKILSETGFYYTWLYQEVGDEELFLIRFKDRLICMYKQEWTGTIRDRDRYRDYRQLKTLLEPERYISMINNHNKRIYFTRARANVLSINANLHRYSQNPCDKCCFVCKNMIENEEHVLYYCPLYESLRVRFLGNLAYKPIDILLKGTNRYITFKVAAFFFHCANVRNMNAT